MVTLQPFAKEHIVKHSCRLLRLDKERTNLNKEETNRN